jgi:DNA-binding response OmpR family regulator
MADLPKITPCDSPGVDRVPLDGGSARILVVDDEEAICEMLREFLADDGFHVECATSAPEARAALERHRFDLLVLDAVLPGELCFELAEDAARAGTPVILMSGHPDIITRADTSSLFLQKPFRLEQVGNLVHLAIRRRLEAPAPFAQPEHEG